MNIFGRSFSSRRAEGSAAPGAAGTAVLDPAGHDPSMAALTGAWMVDPAHSRIGFSVRHAMVTTVRGAFTDYRSRLYFDGENPTRSSAELVLATGSVDTGVEQRDAHVVGRDFLNAAQYPRMTFKSTAVELAEPDVYRMHGDLTIKDVTRPVVLERAGAAELRPGRLARLHDERAGPRGHRDMAVEVPDARPGRGAADGHDADSDDPAEHAAEDVVAPSHVLLGCPRGCHVCTRPQRILRSRSGAFFGSSSGSYSLTR